MEKNVSKRSVNKYAGNSLETVNDFIVREYPLTIFINGIEIVTLVCSPSNLKELVFGFLLSEGLIKDSPEEINIEIQEKEGFVNIKADFPIMNTNNFLRRNIASCCGKGRAGLFFINDARQVKAVSSGGKFLADNLLQLMNTMETQAELFRLTGGVHCSALGDESIIYIFDDIGRHNAVDKILGAAILNKVRTEDKVLLLSGRISSEIVIKAARAEIPLILSCAAPTDLAVDLAEELNITIVGFARENRFNIYSHSLRVSL